MYFTNPIDLSKKYYTQLSQVKHSQTDNGIKYIISPSFTISLLCIIFYFLFLKYLYHIANLNKTTRVLYFDFNVKRPCIGSCQTRECLPRV